jgi:hypothetical protein
MSKLRNLKEISHLLNGYTSQTIALISRTETSRTRSQIHLFHTEGSRNIALGHATELAAKQQGRTGVMSLAL